MTSSLTTSSKATPSNTEELLGRIKNAFPGITWSNYKYIDEGWDHEVIILDDKLVFRFPDDEQYLGYLKNEIEVLRRLRPLVTTVRIPEYTFVAPDLSFAGYELIPGHNLTPKFLQNLEHDGRSLIACQLAGLLSTMHNAIKNGHDFNTVNKSSLKDDQVELKQLTKQHLTAVLSKQDLKLVQQIIDDTDKLIDLQLPAVFIHGDIYNRHLLWDQATKQLGVIDFSDMNIGDPAFDFAELYEYGKSFVEGVYSFYTGPKDATLLERAWKYQQWVSVYMMTDYFVYHKTSFEVALETFDRIKRGIS